MNQLNHKLQSPTPFLAVKIKQHQDNVEFAGMVEAIDQSLGRILTKLASLGLADDTIVIFFADNGGMSGMNLGNPRHAAVIGDESG